MHTTTERAGIAGVREFLLPAFDGAEIWFIARDADTAREAALDRKNSVAPELAPQLVGEFEQAGWSIARLFVHTTRRS